MIREYHDPSFSSFDMLGIPLGPSKLPRAPKRKRAKKPSKTRKAPGRRSK